VVTGHRRTWRITRRAGAWPRWPLIEDVDADDFEVESDDQMLVLYIDTLAVDEPQSRGVPGGRSGRRRC
jgi:hypothetical protein